MGGQRRTDRFARLFLVNGMNHCTGGPTPNSRTMILQMVRWVENGKAPESILATDRDGARTRPAFKYPLVAKYVGPDPTKDPTGPDKAGNFVAAEPTVEHDDDVEWVGRLPAPAPLAHQDEHLVGRDAAAGEDGARTRGRRRRRSARARRPRPG